MQIKVSCYKKLFVVRYLFLIAIILIKNNAFSQDAKNKDEAAIANGKILFENNCKSCHAVHEKVVGPALKGIMDRRDMNWLIAWVKNPQKMIDSKDEYALKIYNEYKSAGIMTGFPGLKDQDIKNIFAYIVDEQDKVPAAVASSVTDTTSNQVSSTDNTLITTLLIIFIVIIVLLILVLLAILSILKKYLLQRESELTPDEAYIVKQKFTLKPILESTGFKYTVAFLVIGFIGKSSLDWVMSIGMQQGYAPKQPIPFSHKLHVGQYKIDCNYCHTGVHIGKHANIPSANICMNCHGQIKYDSPKLAKLREAWTTGRPIEWVRVHNLPDLSYFNHTQHVNVGGIECQTCHGPIEKMEVVQQWAPLTMGWCINCHRETAVKTEGNAYYDKLVQIHAKNSKEPLLVKDIGGLECSKCHY